MWAYGLSNDERLERHFQEIGYYVQTNAAGGTDSAIAR